MRDETREEETVEEKTVFFQSEVTVDAAYLRRTWSNYGKLARARWILALFPVACVAYLAVQYARGGYTSLGIFALAAILLVFALVLPRLVVGQMLGDYKKYRSDGPRRVSLLSDGAETVLVKYGSTVFSPYRDFERVEEDGNGWYLIRPDRRLIIPKGTTLVGDPAQVRAFLEARLAACRLEAAEEESDDPAAEEE